MTPRRGVQLGLALAAVVAAVLVVVVNGSGGGAAGPATLATTGADTVELAPFEGPGITLADLDGRPMVVNFFASWCGPCAREMPDFEEVHLARGGEVVFVGVNIQDTPAAARDLVERTGVSYQVVRDPDAALFRAFGGVSMPTTVFVEADGDILEVRGGELSAASLEQQIDRLVEAG